MMRIVRSALVAALLAVAPAAAMAQAATPVRSGEHADFTRLVFALSGPRDWRVETIPGRVRLAFEGGLPALDLTDVFTRIPRTRLAAVGQAEDALDLTLDCACPVDVSRLRSGHMVIDIRDPDEPRVRTAAAADLPWSFPERPILFRPLDLPPAEIPRPVPGPGPRIAAAEFLERSDTRQHVAIRELFRGGLRGPDPTGAAAETCTFESIARDHLLADPGAALAALPTLLPDATDELGAVQPEAVDAIARLYLDIGWGQEAMLAMRSLPQPDPERLLLAHVLDGARLTGSAPPDPACGPASTLAALLNGIDPATARGIDGRALAALVTDMHPARRRELEPRLRAALTGADAQAVLAFLAIPERPDAPSSTPAGTDDRAIDAIIASLQVAEDDRAALSETVLVNALAFRQSIPADGRRVALDEALAPALATNGYIVEAAALVPDGAVTAEEILTVALDRLPPGQAAEAAVRLRGDIDLDHPVARRAAELFAAYGLDATATLFEGPATPPVSLLEDAGSPAADPWLRRDFAAMVEDTSPEGADDRGAVARLVLDRNGAAESPLAGDLAIAEAELRAAAALRESLGALLDVPPS